MLDLILFSSAVAITNYIGRKYPLLSSSSSSATISGSDPSADRHRRYARCIFHSCLLLSLLLFSLSILEAAPISWLVVIDRASLFVAWYRSLLWALCILLLVVHPSFLGVVAAASVFARRPVTSAANNNKASAATMPPPSPNRNNNNSEGRRNNRHYRPLRIICWSILCVRFFIVTIIWRLLRRVVGAIIPYRITRVDGGGARKWTKWRRCSAGVVVTSLVSLTLSLLLLTTIGSFVLNFDTDKGSTQQHHTASVLKTMVSVLCAFGMIVASILNGFGCASLPHANLAGVFLKPTPPSIIAKVEDDFRYTMKTLEEKRWMLADGMSLPTASSFTPSKNKTCSEKQRMKQLQEEIIFLQALVGDMNDDIEEMKQSQQLAFAARTTLGRIRGILGVLFSVVLVARVILAANSFVPILAGDDIEDEANARDSNSRKDPLTSIFMWLLGRNIVKTQEQCDLFRQGTSLVLAGVLSVSQVRSFFRVIGALGRRLSRTRCIGSSFGIGMAMSRVVPMKSPSSAGQGGVGRRHNASNDVALLLSSFVMGCYFLACVTVVKMTLPIEYRSSFSAAVGLNFTFNTRFLNVIFLGSSCVSSIVLASLIGIQRNNSERYLLESQLSSTSFQMA